MPTDRSTAVARAEMVDRFNCVVGSVRDACSYSKGVERRWFLTQACMSKACPF